VEPHPPIRVERHLFGVETVTSHIDTESANAKGLQEVVRVSDFALQHKLTSDEQLRLIKLLGTFATRQELLMNVRHKLKVRY
jgi:hypothetical protein